MVHRTGEYPRPPAWPGGSFSRALGWTALFGIFSGGCTLQGELTYDYDLIRLKEIPSRRGLDPGEQISKSGSTSLLLGPGRDELDPGDFRLDPRKIEAVFGPKGEGEYQFILISDLQIRDRCIDLGAQTSRFLDKNPINPIEVTLLNFYQDHADVFYAGFVLKAIRMGLERNRNIDFVAHLGDSMQLGIRSELEMFTELVGKFLLRGEKDASSDTWAAGWLTPSILLGDGREIPFFNLLGNHDVLLMGNFNEHGPVDPRGPGRENPCIYSLDSLKDVLRGLAPFVGGSCRGGDEAALLGGGSCERGYYSVDRKLPDGKLLRLVMLHTNESNILDPLIPSFQRGALYPSISLEQFFWLKGLLEDAHGEPSKVSGVLVFAHNELAEISVNRTNRRSERDASAGELPELLGRYRKVHGFFSGHLHSGCRPVRWRFEDHEFFEYLQPAIQEYPKCWGIVTLGRAGDGSPSGIQVRYYNIEDILDVSQSKGLDVADQGPPYGYQERFRDWVAALNKVAPRIEDRVKLLAEYCYRGSRYDVLHDLRQDVGLAFNPAIAGRLLEIYRGANEFWTALKKEELSWQDHRKLLEEEGSER
jgi:3',5'-cyclic AMP phosphodiesterase CpdA